VDELRTGLAVERTRLLRGVKPGYGPPPPYESVYVGSDQGPLMQASVAVRQAYAEAGVGLPEEVKDQPDFIGLELDFMRHLTEKEAQAWAAADPEEALKVLEKERAFLEEHITRWIPRFCDVMHQEARLDFYRGIARMTKGFVLDEAQKVAELVEWARAAGV
jgi:TorA maturation chaperone TorD